MTDTETDRGCWFHGKEPIPPDCYRVCGECWHAWTAEALLVAHNAILDDIDMEQGPGNTEHLTDPGKVFACPLCIHDF